MSQSSGASIRRIAAQAAARGASAVLSIGPSQPPAQPAAAGPGPLGTGVHREPQPSGPARSLQHRVGDDPDDDGQRPNTDRSEESVGQDAAHGAMRDTEDCPAEDSAEECAAAGGGENDDDLCLEYAGQADEDGELYAGSEPRSFDNPLLRDYDPREQQLEMLIPPHAFPWVAQRIMRGGHPQAALQRIAAFIDEMYVSEQQESCEALQMPSADEQPATQCFTEPPLLSTNSRDKAQQEPTAEQRP